MTDAIRKLIAAATAIELDETADEARVELAAREAEREALHKIGYEPIGGAEASAVQVLKGCVDIARTALASAPNDKRLVPLDKLREIKEVVYGMDGHEGVCPIYGGDDCDCRAPELLAWLATLIGETKG